MTVATGGAPSPRGAVERVVVHAGTHRDSVTLMLGSREAQAGARVLQAAALAAAPLNLELLGCRGSVPPTGLTTADLVQEQGVPVDRVVWRPPPAEAEEPGVAQIGAGSVRPPLESFVAAVRDLTEGL